MFFVLKKQQLLNVQRQPVITDVASICSTNPSKFLLLLLQRHLFSFFATATLVEQIASHRSQRHFVLLKIFKLFFSLDRFGLNEL